MKDKVQERKEKYNCDGHCYTPYYMCPRTEICPETRGREFISTIAAVLTLLAIPMVEIATIILIIARCCG